MLIIAGVLKWLLNQIFSFGKLKFGAAASSAGSTARCESRVKIKTHRLHFASGCSSSNDEAGVRKLTFNLERKGGQLKTGAFQWGSGSYS